MRHKPTLAVFSALIGLATALAGCSQQTLDSAKNDAQHNAAAVNQQAQQAERQARPQFDKLKMQSRVTAALAAANLPTTIHVRADADGVYLRGTVNSAGDKERAGQIARDTLGTGQGRPQPDSGQRRVRRFSPCRATIPPQRGRNRGRSGTIEHRFAAVFGSL